jgi:hypothetical protein
VYALVISLALGAVSAPPVYAGSSYPKPRANASYAERVLYELYLEDIRLSQTPVDQWPESMRRKADPYRYIPPSAPRTKVYIDNRRPYVPHYDKPIQVQPTWNQIPYRRMR